MKITGIHHIELTVNNLGVTREFYSQLPNFELVADHDHFMMFYVAKKFYLGFIDHNQQLSSTTFSERNVGLDHLAFEVSNLEDLDECLSFLDSRNISHGEIEKLSNGSYVLAFRDPDNIQLEFCYKPA